MKYPFSPEILDAMPEELAELFRELELFLLGEICDRLNLADKLNEVTVQDIRVLRSHGIDLDAIKKAIAETANVSLDKVDKLLDDVVARNQQYFQGMADLASVTAPQRLIDPSDTDAIRRQTKDAFRNLTQSLGFLVRQGGSMVMLEPAQAYQWALDLAEMQILSGGVSYNQAIRDAVKELADSGIRVVDYESGHRDHADVAARRAIMTGVNQICDKYAEQSAEYLETDYYEISAHIGARDVDGPNGWENHKAWQGKVYSIRSFDKYPSIFEVCGLGDVTGLNGANCRHKRFPFIEGVSERTWTDEQLAHIDDGHGCTFEGREYTAYQATQKQRMVERTIRKLKRENLAFEKAGLKEDAIDTSVRICSLDAKYKAFSKAANLPQQRERLRVLEFGKNDAVKVNKNAEQYYQKWSKEIGANTSIKTIAKYYNVKYNDSPRYELLKGYARSIEKGDISPLVGFEQYEATSKEVQSVLVGVTTSTGVKIESFATHFIDRVIGQTSTHHKGMRSGVKVSDAYDALVNPAVLGDVRNLDDGDIRQTLYGSVVTVTISVRDKRLIQTNLTDG